MELEGKLIQKLAVQSGTSARGEWSKQEFVIEFPEGNFFSNACFSVWGADKVKELERYQVGDQIKVAFNISSREYNGRWYTDLRAWRISPAGQQPAAAPQAQAYVPDAPAGFAPSASSPVQAPAPTIDDMPGDDLPF